MATSIVEIANSTIVAYRDPSDDTVICRDDVEGYDTSDLDGVTQTEADEYGDFCAMCNREISTAY